MLKFGNKEFRNLQEQVLKNMQDINSMKEGTAVLDEFGIKVVGEVDSLADLPTVAEYKEAHEDWAYGDAYAVGTEAPYTLYILTRENETTTEDHWFDIGEFPAPGPQGETGPEGPVGPQGQTGNPGTDGVSAGFGTITATAQTLVPGSSATATVVASGPDTAKSFAFTFGIPRGQKGEPGGVTDVEVNDYTVVVDGVAKIDLDQYSIAFLDRNQTFSESNTFNGDATFANGIIIDRPGTTGNSKWRIVEAQSGELSIDRRTTSWYKSFDFTPSFFTSYTAATLGTSTTPFSDIYFDGILSDCNNTDYGLVLPDTTNFTENKTIATTDQIPDASNLVHKTGDEHISGYKTFNNYLKINDDGNDNEDAPRPTSQFSGNPDVDLFLYGTGLTVYDADNGVSYKYAFPSDSGVFALTKNIPTATSDLTNDSGFITSSALTNYVDLTSDQTIAGVKSFSRNILPSANGTINLGSSSSKWQHLYLGGSIIWGSSYIQQQGTSIVINPSGNAVVANADDTKDLGADGRRWRNIYLSGNLSDGTNAVSVAHLAQNTPTQWYGTQAQYDALGTYDSNTIYNILES